MKESKTFFKNNMSFFVITACEAAFLIFVAVCSFHHGYSVCIPASDLISSQNNDVTYNGDSVSVDGSDVSNESTLILSSERLNLPSGAYKIDISYTASASADSAMSGSSAIGSVSLSSKNFGSRIKCGYIPLYVNATSQTQDFWIPFGASVNDLKTDIYYDHVGALCLNSITITEYISYRVMRLIGFILLFIAADFIYLLLFMNGKTFPHRKVLISIAFITLTASLPVMTDFLYQGHDLWYHLERITSLASELAAGHFPARIESTMLSGYGYPFSLFYGDIMLYLPAALVNMHVPVQVSYHLYIIMINLITCLSSYFTFKEITSSNETLAVTGSLLYTLCSYRLINIFVRAAVGEYTAMAFIPLVFLGMYRMYSKENGKDITAHDFLPLVFGFSFIIESHVLTAIILLLFIAIFFLIFIRRSIRPEVISAWCWTVILTIGLNIWFMLPFIDSMHMNIVANDPDTVNQIQHEGTYPIQLLSLIFPNITGNTSTGTKGEMTLSIGPALVIGLILCIFMMSLIKRNGKHHTRLYTMSLYCVVSALAALFLSTYIFPWDSLRAVNTNLARFFCQIQFPWRYLSVASFFLTCVTLFGLIFIKTDSPDNSDKPRSYRCALFVITGTAVIYTFTFFGSYISIADEGSCYSAFDSGTGCIMGQEYLLSETNTELLQDTDIILNSTGLAVSPISRDNGTFIFSCTNNSDHTVSVDLPILAYDNYTASTDKTSLLLPVSTGANNRLRITIPADFSDTIEVYYDEPTLWRLSELISLITLISVVVHSLLTNYRENVNR